LELVDDITSVHPGAARRNTVLLVEDERRCRVLRATCSSGTASP
jgi:hypothetical protein